MTKRLLLVDHNALFHRSRSALLRTGNKYTTSDGIPTSGVFSYLNCLVSIIRSQAPTHVVIPFDAGGNARKSENVEYKANRGPLEPDFLAENRILLNEGHYAFGLESVGFRGVEADDIIGTFANVAQFGNAQFDEIIIATVDQDLLQCVTTKTKVLLWNSAKKQVLMDGAAVMDKWGCHPEDIPMIKAIAGDSSDNIKGVKGVGPKTALKICHDAQWLDEIIYEHPKLKDHKETIKANLDLVNLRNCNDLIGPIRWDDYKLGLALESDLVDFLTKYECNSLLKRLPSIKETLRVKS